MRDTKQEWLDFIEWCKQNDKDPKNRNSLNEYLATLKSEKAVETKKLNLVTDWWYDSSTRAYVYQCPECKWENRHQACHCEGCGIKLGGVKK